MAGKSHGHVRSLDHGTIRRLSAIAIPAESTPGSLIVGNDARRRIDDENGKRQILVERSRKAGHHACPSLAIHPTP
jgi:hypothetical protein